MIKLALMALLLIFTGCSNSEVFPAIQQRYPEAEIQKLIGNDDEYLIKTKELRPIFAKFGINEKHLMISLENIYLTYCFKKFHIKIDDIDNITIYKILEILIKKEYEIKFIILPNVVRLSEQKYRKLKSYID